MRRRVKPDEAGAVPARLVRYSPEDWPEAQCHPECAFWGAWWQWTDEHPEADWPVDHHGPDTPWHPELI